jgi:putative endonuclease
MSEKKDFHSWFVYMVECSDGTIYTGVTIDLEKRVAKHNSGKGAKYTKMRLPVTLVYSEVALDRSAGLKREWQIKKLSRREKKLLIKNLLYSPHMKSSLSHLQINVLTENFSFYKKLMTFLGWSIIFETPEIIGTMGPNEASIWFMKTQKEPISNFDNRGVNHIGIKVENKKDVDDTVEFLKRKKIEALFETPRHRPEFSFEEGKTYYQVMFKSPDNILFEVMYSGQI